MSYIERVAVQVLWAASLLCAGWAFGARDYPGALVPAGLVCGCVWVLLRDDEARQLEADRQAVQDQWLDDLLVETLEVHGWEVASDPSDPLHRLAAYLAHREAERAAASSP